MSTNYAPHHHVKHKTEEAKDDEADNLEYFIKFPTPNFRSNDEPSAENDYVFVYNEKNVPIVMLLGWAGCQDRYLMKYSKIYEDRGLITIRYTAPPENLFWKRSEMVPIGEKILKLIYDMNFDSHPIFIHLFSNGGAYLYQHISLAIQHSKRPVQVRGMIFDSAPGERRFGGLYRAISAIFGRNQKSLMPVAAFFASVFLLILWFVEETFYSVKRIFQPNCYAVQTNPLENLMKENTPWPQLFLYSKEDLLIPHCDIEKFAEGRQKRGVNVTTVCFENSEHVKHFISHPTKYIYYVCKFINDCLSIPFNGTKNLNTSTGNSYNGAENYKKID